MERSDVTLYVNHYLRVVEARSLRGLSVDQPYLKKVEIAMLAKSNPHIFEETTSPISSFGPKLKIEL